MNEELYLARVGWWLPLPALARGEGEVYHEDRDFGNER